ncbi:MAG: MBL fold metallo-hydrolase [Phycisphaerales bacterium]
MVDSSFEFTFLGTGTSAGIPIIACDCEVCSSADPRDKRLRAGACVQFSDANGQKRVLLLDATPDLRQQALRHNITRCDGIFFTHNHVDHTFGLDEVRRFNAVMQAPIDIFADANTMHTLERVYEHVFRAHQNVNQSFVATLIPHVIEPMQTIERFGVLVTAIPLLHGRLPMLGFRIERAGSDAGGNVSLLPLAYCTDVSAIPPHAWPLFEGVNTLVLDMLRYRHHPTHFTVDQAITIAQQVGAQQTWFTHMTHDIRHADLDPELPSGMSLAFDGLVLRSET